MNKKLLIIGNDPSVIQALEGAAKLLGLTEIVICDHSEPFTTFFREDPAYVIVADYDKANEDEIYTWRILLNVKKEGQIIVRCGHDDYKFPDFLKLPFDLPELRQILQL
jgi:DNA-binding NtrC family response regulator